MNRSDPPPTAPGRPVWSAIIACAILWAATALASMYFPAVFAADRSYFSPSTGEEFEVKVFGRRVQEGFGPEGSADRVINPWRWCLAAFLALFGATCGYLVACHPIWRWRPPTFRYPAFFVLAVAAAYATLFLAGMPGSSGPSAFSRVTKGIRPSPASGSVPSFEEPGITAAMLLVPAVVIGWAAHTVVAAWGFFPSWRPPPELIADYDDRARPSLPTPE